jgi:transposase
VITARYQDALPLCRQAVLLARFGGKLGRNTLAPIRGRLRYTCIAFNPQRESQFSRKAELA